MSENTAPLCANVAPATGDVLPKPELQKGVDHALKRPANEGGGSGEPPAKRSRFTSWLSGPNRVLNVLSSGGRTLLSNIRAVPADAKPMQSAEPERSPFQVFFSDPRYRSKKVGIVAFHHPEKDSPCDILCCAGFLSSCADLGDQRLQLKAPAHESTESFRNAEASYQALRHWEHATQFAALSALEAKKLRTQLSGTEDKTFSGVGDAFKAMLVVQRAKFAIPQYRNALLDTREAFLLCHGDEMNCVGLILMLLRDELANTTKWTEYIGARIDVQTGSPKNSASAKEWKAIVESASRQLVDVLTVRQMIPTSQQSDERGSEHASVARTVESEGKPICSSSAEVGSSTAHTAEMLPPAGEPISHAPMQTGDAADSGRTENARQPLKKCSEDAKTQDVRPILKREALRPAGSIASSGKASGPATVDLTTRSSQDDASSSEAMKGKKRVRFDDEARPTFSDLLRVQPEKEIRFPPSAVATTMTLANVSQRNVAFKFKASTPSCCARPMSGTLKPGERREICLSLVASVGRESVNEKYLIQAIPVQTSGPLSREEWAAIGKSSMRELRVPARRDAA